METLIAVITGFGLGALWAHALWLITRARARRQGKDG